MTMFMNRNESARIVAAAGFMLKHENMNATDSIVTAFTTMNRCEKAYSASPSPGGKRLNSECAGRKDEHSFPRKKQARKTQRDDAQRQHQHHGKNNSRQPFHQQQPDARNGPRQNHPQRAVLGFLRDQSPPTSVT